MAAIEIETPHRLGKQGFIAVFLQADGPEQERFTGVKILVVVSVRRVDKGPEFAGGLPKRVDGSAQLGQFHFPGFGKRAFKNGQPRQRQGSQLGAAVPGDDAHAVFNAVEAAQIVIEILRAATFMSCRSRA